MSTINQSDEEFGLPEVTLRPLAKISVPRPVVETKTPPIAPPPPPAKTTSQKFEPSEEKSFSWLSLVFLIILLAAGGMAIKVFVLDRKAVESPAVSSGNIEIKTEPITPAQSSPLAEEENPGEDVVENMDEEVENEAEIQAQIQSEPIPSSPSASIEVVESSNQRWYVIIASLPDLQQAMEIGNNHVKNGVNITVLKPRPGRQENFRLAAANFGSLNEATAAMEELKTSFGESIWVLKY